MAKILLIDDDALLRKTVRRALEGQGHEVVEAGNGKEGLAILSRPTDLPHLVITDINMPDMDGIELIVSLRKAGPTTPVIAISGGGLLPKELLLDSASALGALATLTKPVSLEDLLATVDSVMGSPPA